MKIDMKKYLVKYDLGEEMVILMTSMVLMAVTGTLAFITGAVDMIADAFVWSAIIVETAYHFKPARIAMIQSVRHFRNSKQ